MQSWIIVKNDTGEAIMETYDPKKIAALNTAKYTALTARDYLSGLNKRDHFERYADAINSLPKEAVWSSSFGYPGDDFYAETWRVGTACFHVKKRYDRYTVSITA